MKRTDIDPVKLSSLILQALPAGILLNTAWEGQMDTMTIGWGAMGVDWGLPTFTVFVRDSRYTKVLLDQSREFTLSVPLPDEDARKILGYCGTVSGRDHNKFEDLHLEIVPGDLVRSPAIVQLPLTLECKVIYEQKQDQNAIPESIQSRYYPTGDYHTAYTGQIVKAYLLEEE